MAYIVFVKYLLNIYFFFVFYFLIVICISWEKNPDVTLFSKKKTDFHLEFSKMLVQFYHM